MAENSSWKDTKTYLLSPGTQMTEEEFKQQQTDAEKRKQLYNKNIDLDSVTLEISDNKGNVVSTGTYEKGTDAYNAYINNLKTGSSEKLFKHSDGTFSSTPEVSISLDTKTHKVKVSAPEAALKNEKFKGYIDSVAKTVSANHKLNPDYKYALLEGNGEKTSEEWIADVNKDIKTMAEQAVYIEDVKSSVKDATGKDIDDELAARRGTIALAYNDKTGKVETLNDNAMQAIPKRIKNMNVFKNLEGWDENSHVVSWGKLKEKWSRVGIGGDGSDENILAVYKEVEDYFDKGDFSDVEEYVEMLAFRDFIQGKSPETGKIQGAIDVATGIAEGLFTGSMSFWEGAAEFAENLFNIVGRVSAGKDEFGKYKYEAITFWSNEARSVLDDMKKEISDRNSKLNQTGANAYVITDVAAPLILQIAAGNGLSDFAAAGATKALGAAGKITSKIADKAVKSSKGAELSALARSLGSGIKRADTAVNAAKFIEATGRGAKATDAAIDIVKTAYDGTSMILKASSVPKSVSAIQRAVKTVQNIDKLVNAGKFVSLSSKAAGFAGELAIDIALTDPRILKNCLESDEVDNGVKSYLLEQATQNALGAAFGFTATKTIGKAIKGFQETDFGVVASAYATRYSKGITSRLGQRVDDFKTLLHGGDENWLLKKAEKAIDASKAATEKKSGFLSQRFLNNRAHKLGNKAIAQSSNRAAREAAIKATTKEAFSDIVNATSAAEEVAAARKYTNNVRDAIAKSNYVINKAYNQNISGKTAELKVKYENFANAEKTYTEALGKALKFSDEKAAKKVLKGEISDTMKLPKEHNEYVNAIHRVKTADDYIKHADKVADGNSIAAAQKERDHYLGIIAQFKEDNSAELVSALNSLEEAGINLSTQNRKVRLSEGVLDEATAEGWETSGFFESGYMRQQRVKDWEREQRAGDKLTKSEIKRGKLRGDQHYAWGNVEDEWQDVTITLFDDINETSRRIIRRETKDALKGIGQEVEVVVSGEDVILASKVSAERAGAMKSIENSIKKSVGEMDDDIFKDVVSKQKVGEYLVKSSEQETLESGRRVAEAAASQPKVYPREKVAFINNMDGEQLDELISNYGKENPFAMAVENDDDFRMFLNKLDPKTRKIVTSRMDGQVGYLFDAPMSEYDRRMVDIAAMPKYSRSAWEKATGKKVPSWASQFVIDKGGKELEDLTVVDELKKLVDDTKALKKAGKEAGDIYNLDNFYATLDNDEDLVLDLKRSYSANNKDIRDNKTIEDIISDQKREQAVFDRQTIYADNVKRMNELKKAYDLEDIQEDIDKQLDEMFDSIVDNNINNKDISEPVGMLDDSSDAIEYMTFKEMSSKGNKTTLRKKFEAKARDNYNQILTSRNQDKIAKLEEAKEAGTISKEAYKTRLKELKDEGKLISKRSEAWGKEAGQWFEDKLETRYSRVQARLSEKGSDILDYGDYFGKIDAINKEIAGAQKADDIIKTYDNMGRAEYIRVSPTVATMMTLMPPPLQRSTFGKIQLAFCKTFRIGTTGGFIPGSLTRQLFRDTGQSIGLGGVERGSKYIKQQLTEEFGETIADYMEKDMPGVWSEILERASGDRATAIREAVGTQMELGQAVAAGSKKESELYNLVQKNRFSRGADGKYDKNVFDRMKESIDGATQKMEKLNNMREEKLRTLVYHNNLLKGMKEGMSLRQAQSFARFMSEEATTNFSRGTYHFANLSESVPYLGAAINSTKSFWRLATLDPVGVSTRIIGGFVVPTIALTTLSLSNEEDRRIYKQIPEWQKDDNLVLVMNGQIMSIPIPQEISSVVRPIQTMVEQIQGVNEKDFGMLMLNNLVGFSPVDLSGFINVDRDRLLEENLLEDHLIPGVAKLMSNMMSPLEKSAFMVATNYDPYTNKYIDKNNVYYDEETGESITMDTSTSETANLLSKLFGGNVSPKMAQKLIKNLFGEGGQMLGDGLVGLGEAVVDGPGGETILGKLGETASDIVGDATDSFSIDLYGEEANLAWNNTVNRLYREKEALLSDESLKNDLAALRGGKLSESAEKEVRSRVNTKIEAYQQKVLTASQNLVTEYNGSFDRFKFGAVVSLLNMYDDESTTGITSENAYNSSLNDEQRSINYATAIETMQRLGFTSTDDNSIFGYYDNNKQDFVYKDPLSILNFKQNSYQQAKIHNANIEALLKEKDEDGKTMFQKHKDFTNSLQPLYDSKNYDEIDKRIIEWDKEVMKTIAPYVSRMTPEAAINNYEVMDALRSIVEVPSSFEKTKYGKFFSLNSKYGSKSDAFVEGWIKSMYGINDPYKGKFDKEI